MLGSCRSTPVFFTTSLHHALVWSQRVLDVDALRAKATSPLAEVWLHGKLLYALMLERRMRRQLGDSWGRDRKSTRLNSSHRCISYAVFCLKKKNNIQGLRTK